MPVVQISLGVCENLIVSLYGDSGYAVGCQKFCAELNVRFFGYIITGFENIIGSFEKT